MEINGVLQVVTKYILRQPKKLWDAQLRLILPVAVRRWRDFLLDILFGTVRTDPRPQKSA